jgi:hypothetical protein
MSRDEYILYLADKVASGEIDFFRVRKELERYKLNEVHTRSMISLIDQAVISRTLEEARRKRRTTYTVVGVIMTTAGLIASILFMKFGPLVYFLGYGPFATGLGLIVAGRRAHLPTSRTRGSVGKSFRKRWNG